MRKRLIFLLPLTLLACRFLIPNTSSIPANTPIPIATSESEATAFAPGPDFTLVRIYAKDGDLQTQLAAEVKKAQALKQAPFVEFDATWCQPCQAITDSLAAKNTLMLNAYSGIYLVHVDVDEWGWGDPHAGFIVKAIPIFFGLDTDGKTNGTAVDGGAWGEDIPENIAPILTQFFHLHKSKYQGN
jgi:hypothetical protein